MFNLLRRSKKQRKAQTDDSTQRTATTTNEASVRSKPKNKQNENAKQRQKQGEQTREHYRPLPECEFVVASQTAAWQYQQDKHKAAIDEFDDLDDLDEAADEAFTATIDCGEPQALARAKVNLAKTAASSWLPKSNSDHDNDGERYDEVVASSAATNGTAAAALYSAIEASRSDAKSSDGVGNSTKAKQQRAFSRNEVNGINKIATLLVGTNERTQAVSFGASNNNKQQRTAFLWPQHGNEITAENFCEQQTNCRTLPTAAEENANNQEPKQQLQELDQRKNRGGKSTSSVTQRVQQSTTVASSSDSGNEVVKLRQKSKTAIKEQKPNDGKRQSRLSLTLAGFSLTSGRGNKATANGKQNSESLENLKTAPSADTVWETDKAPHVTSEKLKTTQKAKRVAFFQQKSQSLETSEGIRAAEHAYECETRPSYPSTTNRRNFFSDIFMARGRNQQRNQRNHIQQQQQQQQPSKCGTHEPTKYAAHNQHKQQQQPSTPMQSAAMSATSATTTTKSNATATTINRHQLNHVSNNNCSINTTKNAHLEQQRAVLHGDPNGAPTYQITASNNSATIHSHNRVAEHSLQQPARRSNSAESTQHQHQHNQTNHQADRPQRTPQHWRSHSVEVTKQGTAGNETASTEQLQRASNERNLLIQAANSERNTHNTTSTQAQQQNEKVNVNEQLSVEERVNKLDEQTVKTNVQSLSVVVTDNNANTELASELTELTECDRDSLLLQGATDSQDQSKLEKEQLETADEAHAMGQANAKPEPAPATLTISRANSVTHEFRESQIQPTECQKSTNNNNSAKENNNSSNNNNSTANAGEEKVRLPTITVEDCSEGIDREHYDGEEELFFDIASERSYGTGVQITAIDSELPADAQHNGIVNVAEANDNDDADDDEVFYEGSAAGAAQALYQQNKWSTAGSQQQMRFTPIKLENVPEEAEDVEEIPANAHENAQTSEDDDNDEGAHSDSDAQRATTARTADTAHTNLDNELYNSHCSPERSPLKSTNTSDSNLSTSYPDSGIGDSQCSNASSSHESNKPYAQRIRVPFVRDGYSTDCDETLLQYDELDYQQQSSATEERLVCIESISLPDVVVESTNGNVTANNCSNTHSPTARCDYDNANAVGAAVGHDDDDDGEQIINISTGSHGNSMGNVHFIPIHIERNDTSQHANNRSSSSSPSFQKQQQHNNNNNAPQKRRSIDDSFIGSGLKKSASPTLSKHSYTDQHYMPPTTTIEIIEDETGKTIEFGGYNIETEKIKRELNEQKARLNVQLEDAQKNVHNLQNKVQDMQSKIEKLEQELSTKTWNVERLQSELQAAHTDDDYVRKKLKMLEDEKTSLRHKISENADEFRRKYDELETQYNELQEKFKQTQKLASTLQGQLAQAQSEAEEWRSEVDRIRNQLEEQLRILKSALDNSEAERKICEDRWQKEFEMLRTHNMDHEETIMNDCEWQLRQMQRQCKDRLDKSERARKDALEKVELMETELAERKQEVTDLRVYQAQVNSLRGVVNEQDQSIKMLMQQIENLKGDLDQANENLEEQIDAVRKIKLQCDNAIYDKERQMIYRIDEVRHEAAAFWEDKLYTEMTRLKNELESVYVDERREALDKLQNEHIEELRALTTRYTANEEELQAELTEVQEQLARKSQEYLELREKSDNALLQTRMHLDRADREYQNAMCREEERREALEESLRKEFETEKLEMEEKFRERLNQVKEEFSNELQMATHEMLEAHKKELEKQKAQLQAEKEEALQELTDRHRKKLADAEDRIKDIELRHQRDLKDLKEAYLTEKAALDKRDISNANEIEQLHRKCRCLTNLFEEMRMRYERRDPRQEDLREIAELRTRCESQERDLYVLTDRLREMQIEMSEMQQQQQNGDNTKKPKPKAIKKPPPKTLPTSCDVIYEENEERDSPPPIPLSPREDDDVPEEEEEEEEEEDTDKTPQDENENIIADLNVKNIKKKVDMVNEDDNQLITAV